MIVLTCGACRIGQAMKRPSDGPFSAPEDVETRLVGRGVARYVSAEDSRAAADSASLTVPPGADSSNPPVSPGTDTANPPVSPGADSANPPVSPLERGDLPATDTQAEESNEPLRGHFDEHFLQSLTNARLKELAEEMGLDTSNMRKKADYVAALLQVQSEPGGEPLPALEDESCLYSPIPNGDGSKPPDLDVGAEDPVPL